MRGRVLRLGDGAEAAGVARLVAAPAGVVAGGARAAGEQGRGVARSAVSGHAETGRDEVAARGGGVLVEGARRALRPDVAVAAASRVVCVEARETLAVAQAKASVAAAGVERGEGGLAPLVGAARLALELGVVVLVLAGEAGVARAVHGDVVAHRAGGARDAVGEVPGEACRALAVLQRGLARTVGVGVAGTGLAPEARHRVLEGVGRTELAVCGQAGAPELALVARPGSARPGARSRGGTRSPAGSLPTAASRWPR